MSLKDSYFSEDAEEDVLHFLKSEQRKRVLIFPPVNNYWRFLIHQLVQDRFGDLLHTFSIGQGSERRTVVCYKSDYIGPPPQVNGVWQQTSGSSVTRKTSGTMGIESQCSPTASPEHSIHKSRQAKSTPAYEIYRPPAARRARLEKSPAGPLPVEQTSPDTCARGSRQKRPDRAVYVPRHRRGASETEDNLHSRSQKDVTLLNSITPPTNKEKNNRKIPKETSVKTADVAFERMEIETTPKRTPRTTLGPPSEDIQDQTSSVKNSSEFIDSTQRKIEELENQFHSSQTSGMSIDFIDEHMQEPNEINEMNESQSKMSNDSTTEEQVDQSIILDDPMVIHSKVEEEPDQVICVLPAQETQMTTGSYTKNINNIKSSQSENEEKESGNLSIFSDESDKRDRRKSIENSIVSEVVMDPLVSSEVIYIDSEESETKSIVDDDIDKEQCEKQEIDAVKQNLVSEVLVTSLPCEETTETTVSEPQVPVTPPEKKVKKIERPKSKPAPPPLPSTKLNRDECDWDSLFDDNGDCLDPSLVEELTLAVGEVVIEKPKSTYKSCSRPIEISSDEYAHVVEIYNFPSEFKSSDLAAVFSTFNGGFELKWVDDTHCLGVFSSPNVAAEVLASDHPLVKTRPLSEATALSKSKARKSSECLQPFKNRPQTCAALARRLVTKSLGVKLATARQEREQEKIVLREAKEKKKLANKQREDIWEGIVTKPT